MSLPVGSLPEFEDTWSSLNGPTLKQRELPASATPSPASALPAGNQVREKVTHAADLAGEKVGEMVDFAKRELPQRLEGMKHRFKVIQGRAAANARSTASGIKHTAESRARQARERFNYYSREYPVESVLVIAGAAFVLGFALRVWRSNRD